MNSEEAGEVFSQYKRALVFIYEYYCKFFDFEIETELTNLTKSIKYKSLVKFCHQFNVTPTLIHNDEVPKIFRVMTKDKTGKEKDTIDYEVGYLTLFKGIQGILSQNMRPLQGQARLGGGRPQGRGGREQGQTLWTLQDHH